MRLRRLLIGSLLVTAAGYGACTLNPQPLPPRDDENAAAGANDASADSSSFGTGETPSEDAASPSSLDNEAGTGPSDAGDAGDGGEGGDASDGG